MDIKFPELDSNKKVTWACHVDDHTTPSTSAYDMIIGMDLMTNIGIYVDTEDKVIHWEGAHVPLKNHGALQDPAFKDALYHMSKEAPVLQDTEQRQKRILDADYSKVDIEEYVNSREHLSDHEKKQLLDVLNSHPTLFGGGLGVINIKPVKLEVKEGAKPYHARAFPVPKAYEEGTRKEIE